MTSKEFKEPIPIKAGDETVLVNNRPLPVDFRIISEYNYQKLKLAYDSAEAYHKAELERLTNEYPEDLMNASGEYRDGYMDAWDDLKQKQE